MEEFICRIHVYNDLGYDTTTLITYTQAELDDEIERLKAEGYREYNDVEFPSKVYEIR